MPCERCSCLFSVGQGHHDSLFRALHVGTQERRARSRWGQRRGGQVTSSDHARLPALCLSSKTFLAERPSPSFLISNSGHGRAAGHLWRVRPKTEFLGAFLSQEYHGQEASGRTGGKVPTSPASDIFTGQVAQGLIRTGVANLRKDRTHGRGSPQ